MQCFMNPQDKLARRKASPREGNESEGEKSGRKLNRRRREGLGAMPWRYYTRPWRDSGLQITGQPALVFQEWVQAPPPPTEVTELSRVLPAGLQAYSRLSFLPQSTLPGTVFFTLRSCLMSPVDSCWDETCIPVQVSLQFPAMPYYLGLTEVCVWCAFVSASSSSSSSSSPFPYYSESITAKKIGCNSFKIT